MILISDPTYLLSGNLDTADTPGAELVINTIKVHSVKIYYSVNFMKILAISILVSYKLNNQKFLKKNLEEIKYFSKVFEKLNENNIETIWTQELKYMRNIMEFIDSIEKDFSKLSEKDFVKTFLMEIVRVKTKKYFDFIVLCGEK